jgi:lysozyme
MIKSGGGITATVPVTAPSGATPAASEGALSASIARPAETKPLNDKINILSTWKDPDSKFKRNSQAVQTTVSRLPTFEPCPEHEKFSVSNIAGYVPTITKDDKTFEGSGGAGNNATGVPAAAVNTGANNTSINGDSMADSSITADFNVNAFRCQLIIHEGLKNKSYQDTLSLVTGGIGHLMRANEISQYPVGTPIADTQIESWYMQDSESAIKIGMILLGDAWGDLSDIRKRACADLSYNMGQARLSKFTTFLSCMKSADYTSAGKALRDSKWFTQVGRRGPHIVTMITQDIDPNGCDQKFPG